MAILVWDCETLSLATTDDQWDKPWELGFGTACVYNYETDAYKFFGPSHAEVLECTLSGNKVVSFNGIQFDTPLLMGQDVKATWSEIDIHQIIGWYKHGMSIEDAMKKKGKWGVLDGSLGLDAICKNTLGVGKSGKGIKAPDLIKSGAWADIFAYNLQDVRRLRQLFEFIGSRKFCIDGKGNRIEIPALRIPK